MEIRSSVEKKGTFFCFGYEEVGVSQGECKWGLLILHALLAPPNQLVNPHYVGQILPIGQRTALN